MRILVAPNAFKNSLDAAGAAAAIAEGLQESGLSPDMIEFPVGDGGDGTAGLLLSRLGAKKVDARVADPLGRSIQTWYGYNEKTGTAIVELANASGLRLLTNDECAPLKTNTVGTGELMLHAFRHGAKSLILCIGGSATVDGGAGILHALGAEFVDAKGSVLDPDPKALSGLSAVNLSGLERFQAQCRVIVLCDVDNRLLGRSGAATVFGPQKGASSEDVAFLERFLENFATVIERSTRKNIREIPGGGAAGGVAAGLWGLLDAAIEPGGEYFLHATDFQEAVTDCDLVITAEGTLDDQSIYGKAPVAVAKMARGMRKPVIALTGALTMEKEKWSQYFNAVLPINRHLTDLPAALVETENNLRMAAFNLGSILKLAELFGDK
jgi:glycerate 2-kinase